MANFVAQLFRPKAYLRERVSERDRRNAFTLGGIAVAVSVALVIYLFLQDLTDEFLWTSVGYVSLLGMVGLLAIGKAALFPYTWVQTPEEKKRQADAAKNAPPEKSIFQYAWYVRYALAAIGSGLFVYYLIPRFGGDWSSLEWLMIVAYGGAIIALARELALVIFVVGAGLIALNWISDFKLTTPGAILIGALIIAYAIQSNRKK